MATPHPRVVRALGEQLLAWRAELERGAARVGWKIGLNFPEVERVVGKEPVIGHLTSATRVAPGAAYRSEPGAELRAETELALELASDVRADEPELGRAIRRARVALELVDVRRPPSDLEGIVVANAFHRAFALGELAASPPVGRPARLLVGGELRASGVTRGDHTGTVRACARLLESAGERLRAGDVVLAGALTHVPVGPGEEVEAAIDGLGGVSVALE